MEWVQPVIQLVTSGGFGALVWYILMYHIPGIEQRHREERDRWMEYIDKRDEENKEVFDRYLQSIDMIKDELKALERKIDELKGN